MKAIDLRNASFESLKDNLAGLRLIVLNAWRQHGPCTTRQLAQRSGLDILTLRPRTTELMQLGFVQLTGAAANGHEGIYTALSDDQAREQFSREQEIRRQRGEVQTEMTLL